MGFNIKGIIKVNPHPGTTECPFYSVPREISNGTSSSSVPNRTEIIDSYFSLDIGRKLLYIIYGYMPIINL